MNNVTDVEKATGTHAMGGKVVFILTLGLAIGILMGSGAAVFFFRDAVFLNAPTTSDTSTLSYPNSSDRKAPILETLITLPKKLVSEDYSKLISKIVTELNQIGANNNMTIIPFMNTIKQKSSARDFNGFFDLVAQAKNEIRKNNELLVTTREDIAALRKINDQSIKDESIRNQTSILLVSGDTFVQEFSDYFALLNETLSGTIPTQDLLNELAGQVTLLLKNGSSFQSELNALLTLMQQKNTTSTP